MRRKVLENVFLFFKPTFMCYCPHVFSFCHYSRQRMDASQQLHIRVLRHFKKMYHCLQHSGLFSKFTHFFPRICLVFLNLYIWQRVSEGERRSMPQTSHVVAHSPDAWSKPGLNQAEMRSQEHNQRLSHAWQGPNYLSYQFLPPRVHISRKQDWGVELGLPHTPEMVYTHTKHCLHIFANCLLLILCFIFKTLLIIAFSAGLSNYTDRSLNICGRQNKT